MTRSRLFGIFFVLVAGLMQPWPARAQQSIPFDHVHMSAPELEAWAAWHVKHLGGIREGEYVRFGTVLFAFRQAKDFAGTAGSAVDHIGLAVPDVAKKVQELQAAGVKVVTPVQDKAGFVKQAVIEDPWGTRIALVQDGSTGFHHLWLRAADPEATYKWFVNAFGGERAKFKGAIDGLHFGNAWMFIEASGAEPVAAINGRAIDHIGWKFPNLLEGIEKLKAKGITVNFGPREFPDRRIAYLDGPPNLRIEIAERYAKPATPGPHRD